MLNLRRSVQLISPLRLIGTSACSKQPFLGDTVDVAQHDQAMIDRIVKGIEEQLGPGTFKASEPRRDQRTEQRTAAPMYEYDAAPRGIDIEALRQALAVGMTKEQLKMPQHSTLGAEHQAQVEENLRRVPAEEVAQLTETGQGGPESLMQGSKLRSKLAEMLRSK